MIKGQIVGGNFDSIVLRQKKGEELEIGELLVSESPGRKTIFKVTDLKYASQLSQANIEYISGMKIEENAELEMMDEDLRYYVTAELRSILSIDQRGTHSNKSLPALFSGMRKLGKDDLDFMSMPKNPLFIGKLRSGSSTIDMDMFLDGRDVLSHHVLVAATTGRGKSNLTSCILWNLLGNDYAGVLVLDPHDEYYGRNSLGMKDSPNSGKVVYYTASSPMPGARTLKINIAKLKPRHFEGALYLSDAQNDAAYAYYKAYGRDWVSKIILGNEVRIGERQIFNEATINVLRRKLSSILDISVQEEQGVTEMSCNGIFDDVSGQSTVEDICNALEESMMVIVDTSTFSGSIEILLGSLIAGEAFGRYRRASAKGTLGDKPVISIVLEEAPRVLGKEALERGSNIFATIAREGRKFKCGLFTITQLPSLIPKEILANINTKIILGIEMAVERQAIIESACQDISADFKEIASLDRGEALITGNFTKFAVPVKIPRFAELASTHRNSKEKVAKQSFAGLRIE